MVKFDWLQEERVRFSGRIPSKELTMERNWMKNQQLLPWRMVRPFETVDCCSHGNILQVTLERSVHILQHTEDEELVLHQSETVSMAMGLLTAVMSAASKVRRK